MESTLLLPKASHSKSWLFNGLIALPLFLTIASLIAIYVSCSVELYNINYLYLSVYGVFAVFHYALQMTVALLNRAQIDNLPIVTDFYPSVSLNVAGYREDPDFFRACLFGLKHTQYSHVVKTIIVIDGNSAEDQAMADIASQVYKNCTYIKLPYTFTAINKQLLLQHFVEEHRDKPVLCILQPHAGKRAAIRTAVEICDFLDIDYFVNTDSDTVLHVDAVTELMRCMMSNGTQIAAVAGALRIFNASETLLARVSDTRYYFAFNIERAAQSYFNCVQCISGPLGLYFTKDYASILEEWYNQTFCGQPATSGDDRHATSCLLAKGKQVKFTHLAIAETETPLTTNRFLLQQCRWVKSFYREIYYLTTQVLPKQHYFATYEMSFSLFYPCALISGIAALVVYNESWQSVWIMMVATILFPFLRGLVCVLTMQAEWRMLLIGLYGPLYISMLLPCKLYALATVFDFGWGTSTRASGFFSDKISGLMITVIIFNILLTAIAVHALVGGLTP